MSADTKGRWWRTGASWLGQGVVAWNRDSEGKGQTRSHPEGKGAHGKPESGSGQGDSEGTGGLEALASKQRMNTDVRRAVFSAVMGADSVEDALDRIGKLGKMLRGARERSKDA